LDSSDKVLFQQYAKGDEVKFNLLKPGEYIVRILADNNENKYWDEADFQNEIFAEDSYIYYKVVVVRPLWDSNETWDLKDTRVLDTSKLSVPKNNTAPAQDPNKIDLQSDKAILSPTR
jgi:hypothetical protein